jgi:hypothetical protein
VNLNHCETVKSYTSFLAADQQKPNLVQTWYRAQGLKSDMQAYKLACKKCVAVMTFQQQLSDDQEWSFGTRMELTFGQNHTTWGSTVFLALQFFNGPVKKGNLKREMQKLCLVFWIHFCVLTSCNYFIIFQLEWQRNILSNLNATEKFIKYKGKVICS